MLMYVSNLLTILVLNKLHICVLGVSNKYLLQLLVYETNEDNATWWMCTDANKEFNKHLTSGYLFG